MRKGNRLANRIAVAGAAGALYAFLCGIDTVKAQERGETEGYFDVLASAAPIPMAVVLLYCALSPVVWPVLISADARVRPDRLSDRLRCLVFHWGATILAVVLAGRFGDGSPGALLSAFLRSAGGLTILGASAVFCLLSPFLLPVLWEPRESRPSED
ncbi:hypothetical protein [Streptomyces sp. EN23]|uniref:hypothetical protein n=1 Tax=Streptomyces sp. EN23 TaxID=212774 RepID=UPI000A9AE6C8|nr:hypothetical protein [Streptomyces sp. EN23]